MFGQVIQTLICQDIKFLISRQEKAVTGCGLCIWRGKISLLIRWVRKKTVRPLVMPVSSRSIIFPLYSFSLHISLVDTTGLDHVRVSLHELPANLKSMAKALEMQLMSAAKHLAVSWYCHNFSLALLTWHFHITLKQLPPSMSQLRLQDCKERHYETLVPTLFSDTLSDWESRLCAAFLKLPGKNFLGKQWRQSVSVHMGGVMWCEITQFRGGAP